MYFLNKILLNFFPIFSSTFSIIIPIFIYNNIITISLNTVFFLLNFLSNMKFLIIFPFFKRLIKNPLGVVSCGTKMVVKWRNDHSLKNRMWGHRALRCRNCVNFLHPDYDHDELIDFYPPQKPSK